MAKHFHFKKIEPTEVTAFESTGTNIRVFISEEEAPNFIMRRFEIAPGGKIGIHQHPWEHEMYILSGEMFLLTNDGEKEKLVKNEFVYMPPNEPHGYVNENEVPVSFICMIPKKNH
ncbi:hypothetical protein NEF87_004169 [Candidatus Lokiarchaeum ossiferum]|uniref:Cupin type-2 domain-containing protein n=1 Tax=Candidatus Lokiarchaeum ossiferum TaxID=2951803 RepID=A0ABY6HZ91_9ARCH|nr:hypothetical protein NEF87_004169 [Candidatus Lokiarchaeum sp. B-35]